MNEAVWNIKCFFLRNYLTLATRLVICENSLTEIVMSCDWLTITGYSPTICRGHLSYHLSSSSWSHFSFTQFFSLMLVAINSFFSFHVFNTGSYWPGLFHASSPWLTGGDGQWPFRASTANRTFFSPLFLTKAFCTTESVQLQQVSEVFHRM